jgi:sulfatase modifying factor 1
MEPAGKRAQIHSPKIALGAVLTSLVLGCGPAEHAPPAALEPEMVRLEGGEFVMGHDGYGDYSPAHTVRLDPFLIDKYEVTNAQYARFCQETGHALPFFWGSDRFKSGPDYPNHPVVGVSVHDAEAYAQWRGVRLPTEAEWEYAGRGGLVDSLYAGGSEFDSTLYLRGTEGPVAVDSYPPNGFGLHHMTGNVAEWVHDRFRDDYYGESPAENPTGPYGGDYRVIRGGGWHTGPYCSRIYMRYSLKSNWVDFNLGFRCAQYLGRSAADSLETILRSAGIQAGLQAYRGMRRAPPGTFYFDESEINEMGYRLVGDSLYAPALEVMRWNVDAHPRSPNAHDSLGEVYALLGDRGLAIASYRQALALHPGLRTARQALEKLGVE